MARFLAIKHLGSLRPIDQAGEEWRPIASFSDYEISNYGRVRSQRRRRVDSRGRLGRYNGGHILRPERTRLGYLRIRLSDGERQTRILVHRLVAEAFIGPTPSPAHEVNHLDADKSNNKSENLAWCTRAENMKHARGYGLWRPGEVSRGKGYVLTAEDALTIAADPRVLRSIATSFGIATSTVHAIKSGVIWSSVTGIVR